MVMRASAPHPGDAPPLMGPYGDTFRRFWGASGCLLGDAIGFTGAGGAGGAATGLKMRYCSGLALASQRDASPRPRPRPRPPSGPRIEASTSLPGPAWCSSNACNISHCNPPTHASLSSASQMDGKWQSHATFNPSSEQASSFADPLDPIAKQLWADWDVGCMVWNFNIELFRGRCTDFDNPILLFPPLPIMRQANVLLRIFTIPPVPPNSALATVGKPLTRIATQPACFPKARLSYVQLWRISSIINLLRTATRQRKPTAGDRLATGWRPAVPALPLAHSARNKAADTDNAA